MRHFHKEYKTRVEEIEKYFTFLYHIDSIETHNNGKLKTHNDVSIKVDRDLQKILRSYTFLLLYSLIESTLSNGITEIYDNIHDNKLNYNSISEEFQKIWLEFNGKKLSEQKQDSKVQHILKNLISECTELHAVSFEKHRVSISGNLDFKNINKIRTKYGFKGRIPNNDPGQLSSILSLIKNKRNYLAHGNESFTKASALKTFKELLLMKNETIIFLDSLVQSIDDLISNKRFQKQ